MEQPHSHSQPKPLPVQIAVESLHQDSHSTATSGQSSCILGHEESAIIKLTDSGGGRYIGITLSVCPCVQAVDTIRTAKLVKTVLHCEPECPAIRLDCYLCGQGDSVRIPIVTHSLCCQTTGH